MLKKILFMIISCSCLLLSGCSGQEKPADIQSQARAEQDDFVLFVIGSFHTQYGHIFIDWDTGDFVAASPILNIIREDEIKSKQEYYANWAKLEGEIAQYQQESTNDNVYIRKGRLSESELQDFRKAFVSLKTERWKKKYENKDILDGTQWSLLVCLPGQPTRRSYGSNAHPANFKELHKLLTSLTNK